jgi:hypothetical protein
MKHFTIIEIGHNVLYPMIGTIDNIPNSIQGVQSFKERFLKALKERLCDEDFNYDEIPDLFTESAYEEVTIECNGINHDIRILETWHY